MFIMLIIQIIGYIFVINSVILFGSLEAKCTTGKGQFPWDKIFGRWYGIGLISSTYNHSSVITCYHIDITELVEVSGSLREVISYKDGGVLKTMVRNGNIINSEIHLHSQSIVGECEYVYAVQSYNNDGELVLHGKNPVPLYYILLSRVPTISVDSKRKFQKVAADSNVNAVYFDHTYCQYSKSL